MSSRVIFHIDVNSAFVQWSAIDILERDPKAQDIRKIEAIVGGNDGTRRGVVVSKSAPAKKLSIKIGESVTKVKSRYPSLVVIEPDFDSYKRHSEKFIALLYEYTEMVEQASIDEAYIDVTSQINKSDISSILDLAYTIKNRVRDELGFTVNVGISTNKLLAKMASDFEKPDRVHTLFKFELEDKLYSLPIENLYGCGKATTQRLKQLYVETIGDVVAFPVSKLQDTLGNKTGQYIYNAVRGIGDEEVKTEREGVKSYSREVTTEKDITKRTQSEGVNLILDISGELTRQIQSEGRKVYTIAIVLRDSKFTRYTRQITLPDSTSSQLIINTKAQELYRQLSDEIFSKGLGIRLVGVRLSNIDDSNYYQFTIFDYI